jgi:hypothetical protein
MAPPDTVPDYASLSVAEAHALMQAIQFSFGNCTCQSWHMLGGARIWVDTCAAHSFLNEHDRHVSRLARLLWVRRTRDQWRTAEWGGRGALLSHDLGLAQLDQDA